MAITRRWRGWWCLLVWCVFNTSAGDEDISIEILSPNFNTPVDQPFKVTLHVEIGDGPMSDTIRRNVSNYEVCYAGSDEATCMPLIPVRTESHYTTMEGSNCHNALCLFIAWIQPIVSPESSNNKPMEEINFGKSIQDQTCENKTTWPPRHFKHAIGFFDYVLLGTSGSVLAAAELDRILEFSAYQTGCKASLRSNVETLNKRHDMTLSILNFWNFQHCIPTKRSSDSKSTIIFDQESRKDKTRKENKMKAELVFQVRHRLCVSLSTFQWWGCDVIENGVVKKPFTNGKNVLTAKVESESLKCDLENDRLKEVKEEEGIRSGRLRASFSPHVSQANFSFSFRSILPSPKSSLFETYGIHQWEVYQSLLDIKVENSLRVPSTSSLDSSFESFKSNNAGILKVKASKLVWKQTLLNSNTEEEVKNYEASVTLDMICDSSLFPSSNYEHQPHHHAYFSTNEVFVSVYVGDSIANQFSFLKECLLYDEASREKISDINSKGSDLFMNKMKYVETESALFHNIDKKQTWNNENGARRVEDSYQLYEVITTNGSHDVDIKFIDVSSKCVASLPKSLFSSTSPVVTKDKIDYYKPQYFPIWFSLPSSIEFRQLKLEQQFYQFQHYKHMRSFKFENRKVFAEIEDSTSTSTKELDDGFSRLYSFAPMVPGQPHTYQYKTEGEYYKQYSQSYYAITFKKSGWDCLRHYEILMSGCIPYFLFIEELLEESLLLYRFPKSLILKAMNLPGVPKQQDVIAAINEGRALPEIDVQLFNKSQYWYYQKKLFQYAEKELSTSSLVEYMMKQIHLVVKGREIQKRLHQQQQQTSQDQSQVNEKNIEYNIQTKHNTSIEWNNTMKKDNIHTGKSPPYVGTIEEFIPKVLFVGHNGHDYLNVMIYHGLREVFNARFSFISGLSDVQRDQNRMQTLYVDDNTQNLWGSGFSYHRKLNLPYFYFTPSKDSGNDSDGSGNNDGKSSNSDSRSFSYQGGERQYYSQANSPLIQSLMMKRLESNYFNVIIIITYGNACCGLSQCFTDDKKLLLRDYIERNPHAIVVAVDGNDIEGCHGSFARDDKEEEEEAANWAKFEDNFEENKPEKLSTTIRKNMGTIEDIEENPENFLPRVDLNFIREVGSDVESLLEGWPEDRQRSGWKLKRKIQKVRDPLCEVRG